MTGMASRAFQRDLQDTSSPDQRKSLRQLRVSRFARWQVATYNARSGAARVWRDALVAGAFISPDRPVRLPSPQLTLWP